MSGAELSLCAVGGGGPEELVTARRGLRQDVSGAAIQRIWLWCLRYLQLGQVT
jgi:hypothetical protein